MTSINPWLSPNAGGFGGPQQRQQLGPQLQPVQPQSPSAYTPNPALGQMANSITQQATSAFNRQVMPGVRNEASAMGQYGGSRQGVVEANAMKDLNQGIANSLAGLYYGDYNNQMNRNLAQYQGDQSYNLGLQGQNNQFAIGMGNWASGTASWTRSARRTRTSTRSGSATWAWATRTPARISPSAWATWAWATRKRA